MQPSFDDMDLDHFLNTANYDGTAVEIDLADFEDIFDSLLKAEDANESLADVVNAAPDPEPQTEAGKITESEVKMALNENAAGMQDPQGEALMQLYITHTQISALCLEAVNLGPAVCREIIGQNADIEAIAQLLEDFDADVADFQLFDFEEELKEYLSRVMSQVVSILRTTYLEIYNVILLQEAV